MEGMPKDKEICPVDWVRLGSRIKQIRIEKHITQEELSAAVEYTAPVSVSNVENAKFHPSIEKIVKIANALSVSVGDLLEDNREKKRPAFSGEFMNAVKDCDDFEIRMLSYMLIDMKNRLKEKEALEKGNGDGADHEKM